MYRWLSWQQYGSDVVVIHRVVSPSTWSIVLRVNATCAYTWRAPFAHMESMHSLTAAPCPIISKYGSKVKYRITCRSICSGPLRPPLLMNAINCHCRRRGMHGSQLYLSPFETHLNCTAGDVFRNHRAR